MGDIWGFFEIINEIVYVADIETYELIYMNMLPDSARGLFPLLVL